MIDRSMSIVSETEQIADLRYPYLESTGQISDGLRGRFFTVRGEHLRLEFNALRSLKTIE
jgi:hypothetical protein